MPVSIRAMKKRRQPDDAFSTKHILLKITPEITSTVDVGFLFVFRNCLPTKGYNSYSKKICLQIKVKHIK